MMKYQKAVEKAKLARGEAADQWADASPSAHAGTEPATPTASVVNALNLPGPSSGNQPEAPVATATGAWEPPVYTHSRTVTPDASIASKNCLVGISADMPEQEYYKLLRTQLMQRMKPNGWNMVMITSVSPGEGKSLTSINLAIAVAKSFNQTVLLVDCDLRRQRIWRYLGLNGDMGIGNYLNDGNDLKDLIIWPQIEKMTLISGGRETTESAELLGSPRMRELMAELKARYKDRLIIIDTPPILSGADTMVMAPYVDGIVIVVESGKTTLKQIQSAMERVPREKFLGFVLNKHVRAESAYYMRYYSKNEYSKG